MKNGKEYIQGYEDAIKDFNKRVYKFSINSYNPIELHKNFTYLPPIEYVKERMIRKLVDQMLANKVLDFYQKRDFLEGDYRV